MPLLKTQEREAEATKLVDKHLQTLLVTSRVNKPDACSSSCEVVVEVGTYLPEKAGQEYMKTRSEKSGASAEERATNPLAGADAYEAAATALDGIGLLGRK